MSERTRGPATSHRGWLTPLLLVVWLVVSFGTSARAQAPPPTLEQLAERLSAMEAANKRLTTLLEQTQQQSSNEIRTLQDRLFGPDTPTTSGDGIGLAALVSPVPDYTEGHFEPFEPAPGYPESNIESRTRLPLRGTFGPGFLLQTENDLFSLQIHYESQIEGRVWAQDRQLPANSGLFLPRQRIFFDGHITKGVEYEFAINRGLNNINLLNAYINLHCDDKFQLRFGRFFTPLPYDQYAISNYWLPTPERSLFTTNMGLNRQIGAMAWGYLFGERLDYAAGVFNGSRNSFESLNNGMDFVGYLNGRPFQQSATLEALRFLNVGTSVAYGYQDQPPVPRSFRIGGGSPDANIPGIATVPFLILDPDVIERGQRLVGSVHAAYFYKGLSLIGEWQYGFGDYEHEDREAVRVPFSGFYVTAGYFLTGEHIERRTRVKPLRPVIPSDRDQASGIGAWELVSRVSQLSLGNEVFDGGLADADLWSNRATTTEVGMNWYWNEYIKMYMFWLHGDFGSPVQFRPGEYQKSADMFWLRFQLYF